MRNHNPLKTLFLISTTLLFGFLLNTVHAASGPQTPEALFKEIIKKLEANDINGVLKNFAPDPKTKSTLTKMKPEKKVKFIAGLKKARFGKKINPDNILYIVPYDDGKKVLDLEMALERKKDGEWIVTHW